MMRRMHWEISLLGLAIAAACLSEGQFALGQYSADERFLSGLRAQRLFDLAEDVCRHRLSASTLTPRQRVTLTVEQILVLTEKGVNVPLADRPAAFAAARAVAAEFATAHAANPRGVLVRFQDALTLLTLGELQRLEADLGASSPAEIDAARKTLHDAASLLDAFANDLRKLIPEARRATPDKEGLTPDELSAIQSHVGYQLARAARNQALLYPEKSEDRTASLLRGKRQLEETVTSIAKEEPLYALATIELATFERMLGDLPRAATLLEDLEAAGAPGSALPVLRAEQVRLLIAQGKAGGAVSQGGKWADALGAPDADLDLAILEAEVADQLGSKSADSLIEKITELETRHGPYWGRRGSALVLKNGPAGMTSENVDLISRTADQLFLQRNFEAAIAAYDRGAAKAKEAKNVALFVDLSKRAALVEQERHGYSEAVRRFLDLAAAPEAAAIAPDVHLAAAWNQAQLLRVEPSDAKVFVRYEEILKDQIAKFKDSPTANIAKLWLARIYESRGEFAGAYRFANEIPADAKERDEALQIGLREWNRRSSGFDNRKSSALDKALEWAKSAERDLSSPTQRQISLAAVGWELLNQPEVNHAAAAARLKELLEKTPPAEVETIEPANTLLVVALGAQPEHSDEAEKLLAQAGGTAKQQLQALLGLVKVLKTAGHEVKPRVGEIVLKAITKLHDRIGELGPSQRIQVDLAFAEATAVSAQVSKADGVFSALAKRHPNSAEVQEAYAHYLMFAKVGGLPGTSSLATPANALAQWRLVASRSEPQSERWYRAKYHVAKIQSQMGQSAEAAKLIDYLDATPPGLKGAPLEAEFRALRGSLSVPPPKR